jgi:hypothetical protein
LYDQALKEKLDKLESLVRDQEQRIHMLENRNQERPAIPRTGSLILTPDGDLTEHERRILKYITIHPNVTKQDIVDHFKGEMARVPVFNTIDSLVRYGIIEDNLDPKNRQAHRLTLNNESVFYSVLQELNQFEESFKRLTLKIALKSEEIYASNPAHPKDEYFRVITQAYRVFNIMLQSYIVRYTFVWAKKFSDRKDVLNKLTAIVLTRITNMRESLPGITVEGTRYFEDLNMISMLQGTQNLKDFVSQSEKFGLTGEMEPVLDALWNINKEVQEYAYPEPRLFFWDEFKYGKDNWRKLLELTKKHPDESLDKMQKIPINGILNKPLGIRKLTY